MIRLTSMLSKGGISAAGKSMDVVSTSLYQILGSKESFLESSLQVVFPISPLTHCVMGSPSIWEGNSFHLPGRSRCDLNKSSLRLSGSRTVRMILPLCLAESSRHGASRILIRVTLGLWGGGQCSSGQRNAILPSASHWLLAAPGS